MTISRHSFLRNAAAAVAVGMLSFTGVLKAKTTDKPNILWITSEDNNINWIGCYGNPECETPNIDKLATEGFRYLHCFSNASVCAPSRSTWITGLYAVSTGTQNMRSRFEIPHKKIRYYPDYMREAGYFCTNSKKTDYNIGGRADSKCWDIKFRDYSFGWKKRASGQPFFCVMNYVDSHESKAQGPVDHTTFDPAKVKLYRYHPDILKIRQNYALYHDQVKKMDKKVGRCLKALKADGLEDDTIVIYCSDHGGVMPRSKRFLYNGSIHCPLIIRIPEKYKHLWPADKPGSTVDRLVSFIDMPKTWLSLIGAKIPKIMQGKVFLGPDAEPEDTYSFSFSDRQAERIEGNRAVRDKRYMYIKNYCPFVPWGQYESYLYKMEATKAWKQYDVDGLTNEITGKFFRTKPIEEFFDTKVDPDCTKNLIDDPEYGKMIEKRRAELRKWQLSIFDTGLIPESEMNERIVANKTTIYELVRNKKLYNLEAYLDTADLALAADPANLRTLVANLSSPDSGIRYWSTIGIMQLGDAASSEVNTLKNLLTDDCHEVRVYAAWSLIKLGHKKEAYKCLDNLIRTNSHAVLAAMTVLDSIGGDLYRFKSAIEKFSGSGLLPWVKGYADRRKTYLLSKKEINPPRGAGK